MKTDSYTQETKTAKCSQLKPKTPNPKLCKQRLRLTRLKKLPKPIARQKLRPLSQPLNQPLSRP